MIDDEMFVHYKRPSKRMKERRRRLHAGASPYPTVMVTGTTQTVNTQYDSRCEMCDGPWHDYETCQSISLKRIADSLEIIQEKLNDSR